MLEEQKKAVEMIQQMREKIEAKEILPGQIPIEDLGNLISATLGRELTWEPLEMQMDEFQMLTGYYLGMIEHMVEQGDAVGCVCALRLLEAQYACFYNVLKVAMQEKYTEKYKIAAIGAGEAYSKWQFRMHRDEYQSRTEEMKLWEYGKGVVYTCILGNAMQLQQPEHIHVDWDYICFTNQEDKWGTREGIWEYRRIDVENQEDSNFLYHTCMVKPYMLLQEYDYSIWVNPKYKIVGDIGIFCESYGRESTMLTFPSFHKNDVYDAMYTTLHGDEENIRVRKKCLQYKKEGYPEQYGMISTSVLVRSHRDEILNAVMETWWEESTQCSRMWEYGFNYAAWRHDYSFAICDLFVEMNAYFKNMELNLEVRVDE